MGNQLGSDTARHGENEEDSSINIVSDGETKGNIVVSPKSRLQINAFPSRKRLRMEGVEVSKPGITCLNMSQPELNCIKICAVCI